MSAVSIYAASAAIATAPRERGERAGRAPGGGRLAAEHGPAGSDARRSTAGRLTIYTIGHSTRPIDEFLALLAEFSIELLADVRTIPQSRRHPQFGQQSLRGALAREGIEYRHLKSLGGLRRPTPESPNRGWRNESFRGYADHMRTPEFAQGLAELIAAATERRTAIMCAEAVPWRCHRSLIGDALLVRGVEVIDIIGPGQSRPHELTPFAVVHGDEITYPAPA